MQVDNIDLFSMGQANVNLGGSRKLTMFHAEFCLTSGMARKCMAGPCKSYNYQMYLRCYFKNMSA